MKQLTLFEKNKILTESNKKAASHTSRSRLEDKFASRLREELRLTFEDYKIKVGVSLNGKAPTAKEG